MGLKQDIINAKVEGLKAAIKEAEGENITEEDIDVSNGSAIEVESELMSKAIVKFLTAVELTVTQLKANVVLEDFKIPPQSADIQPSVMVSTGVPIANGFGPGATTAPGPLQGGRNGVLTKKINISKYTGGLDSTGYVYIGDDPDSQNTFNVGDSDGQRIFTTVKLLEDNIDEDLL
jgi:hypothetical protein